MPSVWHFPDPRLVWNQLKLQCQNGCSRCAVLIRRHHQAMRLITLANCLKPVAAVIWSGTQILPPCTSRREDFSIAEIASAEIASSAALVDQLDVVPNPVIAQCSLPNAYVVHAARDSDHGAKEVRVADDDYPLLFAREQPVLELLDPH